VGERNQELMAARERAMVAVRAAATAIEEMLALVDPLDSHHDDVADLILSVVVFGEQYRQVKPEMEASVLGWLLHNAGGVRSVRVGDWKYWGEKEKSVKCLDAGEAGAALAEVYMGELLMSALSGDEGAFRAVLDALRGLFQEFVSANGLKEGASRKALAEAAERRLRAAHAADPESVQVMEGESPGAALERAVEAAREAAVLRHWEESWPDRLKGGEPRVKLGVASLRFVHRVGGGTKQELEEMERRRLAGWA
jgi:hypothetical protein